MFKEECTPSKAALATILAVNSAIIERMETFMNSLFRAVPDSHPADDAEAIGAPSASAANAERVEPTASEDGTPWPGTMSRPSGMIQVFLGHDGLQDVEGNELPRLVYVSREKRLRVRSPQKCRGHECFGKKICYVQFPPRFDGIDRHDRYSNRNVVFFDINMKGLDGIQGPIYVGTGCVFRRHALYRYDAPAKKKRPSKTCNCWPKLCFCCCCFRSKTNKKGKTKKENKPKHREASKQIYALETIEGVEEANVDSRLASQVKLEKKFERVSVFVASTLLENGGLPNEASTSSLLKEAIHVISCGYEDKTKWGNEVDLDLWLCHEDILTGFKMHCYGWRSVYCMPKCTAFKGSAPINLSYRLHQISNYACIIFISLFISIAATGILEMQWGNVGIDDWWRNEQFWVIGGASSHFFALFQGLLKVLAGVETSFTVTSKEGDDAAFSELYIFKWTSLLIPPMTLLIINIIGVVVGVSDAINHGYDSWGPLFGRLFFALWVIIHLYPFLKGLMGKQERTPTIVAVWSILLASILTLLWVRVNPFVSHDGPFLIVCGLNCDD
ncbi:hypothetical protein RND71_044147 [Anisodus tanguticus]|uniref:Uncharacterized protein n=1 Tax=Anisodus tanguticus TaxID=243964 RepID=A0AAE1QMY9_9SOLA|nr:hypothetical protein RND71_044147 [Anisodus tanguticus]